MMGGRMYEELLSKLGLDESEIKIYEALLKRGEQTAQQVSDLTGLKRPTVYNILYSLITKGFAFQTSKNNTSYFLPENPEKLYGVLDRRRWQLEETKLHLETTLPSLKAQYRGAVKKAIVQSFEGLPGVEKAFEDILSEGRDILLFRSYRDHAYRQIAEMTSKQIWRQAQKQIHSKIITPLLEGSEYATLHLDKERLVERRIVPLENLRLPSQIIVYGSKVAIIDLEKEIQVTLVDNPDVAQTFRVIFKYIWESAKEFHEKTMAEWIKKRVKETIKEPGPPKPASAFP